VHFNHIPAPIEVSVTTVVILVFFLFSLFLEFNHREHAPSRLGSGRVELSGIRDAVMIWRLLMLLMLLMLGVGVCVRSSRREGRLCWLEGVEGMEGVLC